MIPLTILVESLTILDLVRKATEDKIVSPVFLVEWQNLAAYWIYSLPAQSNLQKNNSVFVPSFPQTDRIKNAIKIFFHCLACLSISPFLSLSLSLFLGGSLFPPVTFLGWLSYHSPISSPSLSSFISFRIHHSFSLPRSECAEPFQADLFHPRRAKQQRWRHRFVRLTLTEYLSRAF